MNDMLGRSRPYFLAIASATMLATLGACRTTYEVPAPAGAQLSQAQRMFAEERNPATARMSSPVVRTARSVFPAAEKANDEPTADLLTQRMQVHEKTAWMLRSMLE